MYLLPKTPTARHPSREIGHRDRGRIEKHQEDKLGNKITASAARLAWGLFEWTGDSCGSGPILQATSQPWRLWEALRGWYVEINQPK